MEETYALGINFTVSGRSKRNGEEVSQTLERRSQLRQGSVASNFGAKLSRAFLLCNFYVVVEVLRAPCHGDSRLRNFTPAVDAPDEARVACPISQHR